MGKIGPYVVKIVSLARKAGKTSLGTAIVEKLRSRGISVAVIKHVAEEIDLHKDSDKYIDAGANQVVAVSRRLTAIYDPSPMRSLSNIIQLIPPSTRIVVAEGFKREKIGDAIAIVENEEEYRKLAEITPNLVAIATRSKDIKAAEKEIPVFMFNDINSLVNFIYQRALEHYYSMLPGRNCSLCGYRGCREFAEAYLLGKAHTCPIMEDIELYVNGKKIHLSPYVKQALTGVLLGFITTLKGAPNNAYDVETIELRVQLKSKMARDETNKVE